MKSRVSVYTVDTDVTLDMNSEVEGAWDPVRYQDTGHVICNNHTVRHDRRRLQSQYKGQN